MFTWFDFSCHYTGMIEIYPIFTTHRFIGIMPELSTNHFGRWNSLFHQDEHVHYITSFQCTAVYPGFPSLFFLKENSLPEDCRNPRALRRRHGSVRSNPSIPSMVTWQVKISEMDYCSNLMVCLTLLYLC